MDSQLAPLFVDTSARRLEQLVGRIGSCIERLSDDQVWARGSENENAIGNLMLHLAGNVRQWILSGVGGKPDVRVRDREFSARGNVTKSEMFERLSATPEMVIAAGIIAVAFAFGLWRYNQRQGAAMV